MQVSFRLQDNYASKFRIFLDTFFLLLQIRLESNHERLMLSFMDVI